jgi:hypothetical protein
MGSTPGSEERVPVDVRTRFERFPLSVKGAYVLRGADGNPHLVQFDWGRIARIPEGPTKPVLVEDRVLDVAPNRDLFVPFEVPVTDLPPSWYVIQSSIRVDGGRSWVHAGRPFSIPWSRSEVRRATIRIGAEVAVGARSIEIDRAELGNDAASVVWRIDGAEEDPGDAASGDSGPIAEAILVVDGSELEVLPPDVAAGRGDLRSSPGEHRTISYPVPRASGTVQLVVCLPTGERSKPLDLAINRR